MSGWAYLRDYHTNIRHGDNVANCGDCQVGKCDVPALLADYERVAAQRDALLAAAEAAATRLVRSHSECDQPIEEIRADVRVLRHLRAAIQQARGDAC